MEVIFTVNGEECRIKSGDLPPDMSLNMYLRTRLCLTGTKFMCQEGGCGCCVVTIRGNQPVTGEPFTLAVTSCLFLVYSCHGLNITTIEGIGGKKKGYHPMQERLAHHDGSQCGYCSPGFIMNMYSLYEGKFRNITDEEVEDSFGGNICRCTGYRPILDAFKTFASNTQEDFIDLSEDIEDLSLQKCRKSGKTCVEKCGGGFNVKAANNAMWHKVANLSEVLEIFNSIGLRKYRLVGGNTAHGVYRMPYDIEIFIDVSSAVELRKYFIGSTIELGGNTTITEWMRILLEASDRSAFFTYCQRVRDHLNTIATVPIRNVGTIAGNLMIKHQHSEFNSDVFLLLETIGASLIITDASGNRQTLSPRDFLNVNMEKKIITKIIMPQLAPDRHHVRFYRVSERAQNAISYMNAGFLLQINTGSSLVITARIVYGGVNSRFIHASFIEKYLKGKDLFDNYTIQGVVNLIDSTFDIDDSLPNSSAEFRRRLAIGLFYRTILDLVPNTKIPSFYHSGAIAIARPLSSGEQKYDSFPEKYPLTQPVMKVEALIQCSGEAEYVNDTYLHNALWATFVLSNDPLKTISSIDAKAALAIKGVKAFYSAKDIPGVNSFITPTNPYRSVGSYTEPEEVFCSTKIKYHGQPIGVIVAEEMSQAVYAAELVKIHYVDKMNKEESLVSSLYSYFRGANPNEKILPTLADVFEEDPILTKDRFQEAKVIIAASRVGVDQGSNHIKGHLFCGLQYHYHMETQQTVAVPVEDGMDIFSSTQWMDLTHTGIAYVLGVDNNSINIRIRRLGGGFGGKTSRATHIATAAAIACYHQKRLIRMVLPMMTNMRAIGKRTPAFYEYDLDFNDQGVIQRLNCDITHDLGCNKNEPFDAYESLFESNVYSTPTWTVVSRNVLTDAASNTWTRAPISTGVVAYAETVMEHIAWKLKMDPVKVRFANIAADSPVRKLFENFLESCDYYKRLSEVEKFNGDNRWKKRGIGITLMSYPHENPNNHEALVTIYHGDGTVALNISGVEMGQGLYTKIIQIAASTLGVPIDKVKIKPTNNLVGANTMITSGSWTTDDIGYAVKKCCDTLNARLKPFKLKNPSGTWHDIVQAAFMANIELIAISQYVTETMPRYHVYGCACAEIEIDVLTGNFLLHRVDIVEDVGESISPRIDVGQIEGAFIMGLGYWLHEKLVYNRTNGELLTNRSWNYKPPGAKDIPVDFRISLVQTNATPTGIFGSKITSEPAVSMGVVVAIALRKAIESARKDAGAPDIFLTLNTATTVENILELCGTKNEQFSI